MRRARKSSAVAVTGALSIFLAAAWARFTHARTSSEEPLGARAILDRMANAYLVCRSYRDSGSVRTVFTSKEHSRTEERVFHTAFRRPDRFRFEFVDRAQRYVVWRSGSQIRTWWDVGSSLEYPKSLDEAIAGATGVSNGSALTVPGLLMPNELTGWRLTELEEPTRLPSAVLGQIECFRVLGRVQGKPETVWLDKSTYLVRRIDEQVPFGTLGVDQTTTYDPVVGEDISEGLLAFGLPKPK